MLVDTHVHVVAGDKIAFPVRDDAPAWPITPVESLIGSMDGLGINRALLVQSYFTYGVDNSYVIESATKFPHRLRAVCVLDQTSPQAPDQLTNLVLQRGVRGLRLMPKGHAPGVLSDPRTFPLWECAVQLGVPVLVAAEIEHIPDMPSVVQRFPNAVICFEHMWGLEIGNPPYPRIAPVLELARFPNVHLKLCPNNSYAAREGDGTPRQFFELLVNRFGVQRLMWGSNYPAHHSKFGTLEQRLTIFRDDLSFLSEANQEWIFGGTALSLWPELA